jgi:hypothetical protein
MLDSVLVKHLDEQDKIEEKAKDYIEKLIMSLSVDELMSDPDEALGALVDNVYSYLKDDIIAESIENGLKVAKAIRKDGEIKIQDTDDPEINA